MNKNVSAKLVKEALTNRYKSDTGVSLSFVSVGKIKNEVNAAEPASFSQSLHLTGRGGDVSEKTKTAKKTRGRPKGKKMEGGEVKIETERVKPKTKKGGKKKAASQEVKIMKDAVERSGEGEQEESSASPKKRMRVVSSSSSDNENSTSSSSADSDSESETENSKIAEEREEEEAGSSNAIFNNEGEAINYNGSKNVLK